MEGRVCVITGASSGIGRAAALDLAALGARVVIVARDPGRGAAARDEVAAATGRRDVALEIADLRSQREVRDLAGRLLAAEAAIHVLVNNAGLTLSERRLTEDGLEETFAVNHLAPFLLTGLLLDRLRASAPARVVTVASAAHRAAVIPFDDLNGERGFSGWRAYGWTKLANILFTAELARRLDGSGVTATCLHPGVVATGFAREGPLLVREFQRRLGRHLLLDPKRGADTLVWLAASAEVEGASGGYYANRRPVTPAKAARDAAAARRLWEISERLTGLAG
ncbi:MAG TPA: SDR family NAD(P)-dependent oxidoreductase [Thermoanaerobaculales bacterium]|nr:SDR family NAD(P)-dependent oxidoreductase [Thermoanaerobaculales bacterium]HPA80010.1 SDR family NAD(P)-dependent oxidoreductase [Thermoanaerobaculales bacterium]HQL30317.1 SDR family NAD(P)-dependent oxidoreductase [Thermoanaerobaculales bacterium]HQN95300.1 SDR family NAD(P)-dependent oxidoreductase [Thermoanaerobaculales bacterium]HQP42331.1 SDR family NAD(P)-dependent oxidoreductase [Thermoanaerobaculales bacterium]